MTGDALDRSLFDVEDVERMPAVRDMTVSAVGTSDVQEFSSRYHYTGAGGNASWRWGLWHGMTLLGVVAYNLPTRETCESVFGPDHFDKVWHMGRLALADNAPPNSESRLIGGSLRAIRRQYPDVWAVLTYAAIDAGHLGYVYQATNAQYCGLSDPRSVRYYIDQAGNRRATRLNGNWVGRDRAAELGWTLHVGSPKHRYLYLLGSRSQRRRSRRLLKWPTLPYPKALPTIGGAA